MIKAVSTNITSTRPFRPDGIPIPERGVSYKLGQKRPVSGNSNRAVSTERKLLPRLKLRPTSASERRTAFIQPFYCFFNHRRPILRKSFETEKLESIKSSDIGLESLSPSLSLPLALSRSLPRFSHAIIASLMHWHDLNNGRSKVRRTWLFGGHAMASLRRS